MTLFQFIPDRQCSGHQLQMRQVGMQRMSSLALELWTTQVLSHPARLGVPREGRVSHILWWQWVGFRVQSVSRWEESGGVYCRGRTWDVGFRVSREGGVSVSWVTDGRWDTGLPL